MEQSSLEIVDLQRYAKDFPAKRHLILFRIQPLDAIGAIDISKHLGLTMADRMLGGKGFAVNPDRVIREVESAMIDQVAQLTLREWSKYWKFEEPLRVTLLGHEEDPLHVPVSGDDETFYHISINADVGDCMDKSKCCCLCAGWTRSCATSPNKPQRMRIQMRKKKSIGPSKWIGTQLTIT